MGINCLVAVFFFTPPPLPGPRPYEGWGVERAMVSFPYEGWGAARATGVLPYEGWGVERAMVSFPYEEWGAM
jgi:hypothetical protein